MQALAACLGDDRICLCESPQECGQVDAAAQRFALSGLDPSDPRNGFDGCGQL
jgi:hypothetical protein